MSMLEERIGPELNALLAQVAALVWTTDRDLRIMSVDGGAASRVDSAHAVGRRIGDYFVAESVAIGVHEAALRGQSGQYEHFTVGAPWHMWVDPLRDGDGEIVGTIGVALDMSEDRAHARELATANANMRALVETLPLVVYTATLDFDVRPQFIAPQVEELLGIPQRIFTFEDLRAGIHPEDRAQACAAFDEADVMKLPLKLEYRFVRPDGREVWIEDASRIVEIDGVPLAQGYLLDITERKRTEDDLAQRLEARRRIAEIGRHSLEGMPRADVVREALALLRDNLECDAGSLLEPVDGELVVTDCFGWDVIGFGSPEGTPGFIGWTTQATFAGATPAVGPPSQLGELGIRSSIAAPVVVADGECVGVVTVHARAENAFDEGDIRLAEQAANLIAAATAREQLDERLRVSERLEAVGQLAAGIAHDFNNMLTVIAGYSELALPHADDEGRNHLSQVVLAADRARLLTSQLLAFSRQQVMRKEPLSLVAAVGSTAPMLATLFGENVTVVTAGDDATVIADAAQLDNVFVNLAVNARDAMPDGGRLTVRTGSAEVDAATALEYGVEPGRFGTLTVSDTGSGMPPEVRDRIFEPFFTTKGQGRGTGLGLSSVHGTVHQSGGFVTVESTLGNGSSFTIYLPATEEPVTVAAVQPPAVPVVNARILLVEDEEIVRGLLVDQLTGIGHTVEAVGSAAHALIALEQRSHDVVLSDVGLPGTDGGSLAQAVATRFPDVRVVLMSGYPGDYIADRGVTGEVPLLLKPFTMDELQDALGRVLA